MTDLDRIVYIAPMKSHVGYSIHTRAILKTFEKFCLKNSIELVKKNVNWIVRISGRKEKNPEIENVYLNKLYANRTKLKKNSVLFMHNFPAEWPPYRMGDYQIGYFVFEPSKTPDFWVPNMNRMDEIWVPNLYNAFILRNSGVTVPICIIPFSHITENMGINTKFKKTSLIRKNSSKLNVLIDAQWLPFDRKGIIESILCYTKSQIPIGSTLFLKSWIASISTIDSYFLVEQIQKIFFDNNIKWGDLIEQRKKIVIINDFLKDKDMNALKFDVSDLSMLLTHGEGMWLTGLEMASQGKPIIATKYSAMIDYLIDYGNLVDYELVSVPKSLGRIIYHPEAKWANPNLDDAIEKFENITKKYLNKDKELFKKLEIQINYLKEYWSFDNMSILTQKALDDALNGKHKEKKTYLYQKDEKQFLSFNSFKEVLNKFKPLKIIE